MEQSLAELVRAGRITRETAYAHRALGSIPLHERRELAQVARRLLVVAEEHEVLEDRGRVREGARAGVAAPTTE